MLDGVIEKCRVSLGPPPRKFPLWVEMGYHSVPAPPWAKGDKLEAFFRGRKALLSEGVAVWGSLIQANRALYTAGPHDCPGEVLFSMSHDGGGVVQHLHQVARAVGALKGTEPQDPDLHKIAHYLTDEYIRVFGLPVPQSLSPHIECAISTVYFVRKHMPGGILGSSVIPLLVSPRPPRVAMVIPSRYWPSEFVNFWEHGPQRGGGSGGKTVSG